MTARRVFAVLFAACLAASAARAADPASAPPQGRTLGVVGSGEDRAGALWFSFTESDLRFEAPTDALKDADALMTATKASADREIALTVLYDLDSGYIDPVSGKATFDIREVEVDGKTVVGVASSTDVRRTPASPTEAKLARALALADQDVIDSALADLSDVLQDPKLSAAWRILALKTRANLDESEAVGNLPMGVDRDKALAAALADDRAWAALAPDDAEAARAVARNMAELGGLDEALAAYRTIAVKWPQDDYSTTLGVARALRDQEQYQRALDALDDLVKRNGPQLGMRFHFNRARVLMGLDRMEDAVKEFDAGLKDQPDYPGAFDFRACALASLGRLKEAQADYQKAMAGWEKWRMGPRQTHGEAVDSVQEKAVAARLESAVAHDPAAKLPGLCDGYWDYGGAKRERSPLLAAKGAATKTP